MVQPSNCFSFQHCWCSWENQMGHLGTPLWCRGKTGKRTTEPSPQSHWGYTCILILKSPFDLILVANMGLQIYSFLLDSSDFSKYSLMGLAALLVSVVVTLFSVLLLTWVFSFFWVVGPMLSILFVSKIPISHFFDSFYCSFNFCFIILMLVIFFPSLNFVFNSLLVFLRLCSRYLGYSFKITLLLKCKHSWL